ncbi:23S rRNA (uracil(1939)-C(5))-methyltransferase RlmD [Bacillaceae bacterium]
MKREEKQRRATKTVPMNRKEANDVQLRSGQTILLTVKGLGINGEGVGYYKRKVVFIDGALPGEVVVAKIKKVERNFAYAELVRVKEPSPERSEARCPVYAACGGCQLQHLSYRGQLQGKRDLVAEAFARFYEGEAPPVRETVGTEHPWDYRNKAQWQVGYEKGKVVTGLYAPGTHRLIDIPACPIQHPKTNEIVRIAKEILQKLGIPPYDERKRSGVVRTIVARVGVATGDAQLTLVTATEELPRAGDFVRELRRRLPDVTSIMQNVNPKKTSRIFGEKMKPLWGKETIDERLADVTFSLSPRAFFQLNPEQTVKLYDFVREAAALTGNELVIDAYCGVGTIALWLAPAAKEVRGIEEIREAVEDARRNAALNGIDNVRFYAGKVEELLPRWGQEGLRPDVVVLDPPRSGCEASVLRTLLQVAPERIVYVSCNPSTLAKDCNVLKEKYAIAWVQPVDMFPQTSHVESVTLLTLK